MITEQEFFQQASQIHSYKSVTGEEYADISVNNGILSGIRCSTAKPYKIQLSKLYLGYKTLTEKGEPVTTTTLKPFVRMVQSPSLGLLIAMGLVQR